MNEVASTNPQTPSAGLTGQTGTGSDPTVSYVGPVAVWLVPKPRAPRISLRNCVLAWLILAPLLAANLLWVQAESNTWWPFGRRVSHVSEVLLRYELIVLVCLGYVTAVSVPVWFRYRRLAKRDAYQVNEAIQREDWQRAGLLLHRYCLFVSAVWRKLPAQVAAWDSALRNHLPRHRRLYVYYRGRPPRLPQDATAGFSITVVRPPRPSPWSAAALVPIALMLYLLIVEVIRLGDPHQAFLFNTVLLSVVLVSYTSYFFMALLGRSSFLRFAPGVMQVVRYRALRRCPEIQSYDLRRIHAVLDLSSAWPGFTLLNTPGYRREIYRLRRDAEALEAVFRATLSTVPSPPLPEDLLVD
jgi:hypothetical protein